MIIADYWGKREGLLIYGDKDQLKTELIAIMARALVDFTQEELEEVLELATKHEQ